MNDFPRQVTVRQTRFYLLESFGAAILCLVSLGLSSCSHPHPDSAAHGFPQSASSPSDSHALSIEDAFAKGMQTAKSAWNLDGREYDVSIKRVASGWSMTVTLYPRTWSSQMILGIDDAGKVTALTGL